MTNELSTELTGSIALLNEELQNEAVGYNTQLVVTKINHQEGTFAIPSLPSVPRLEGIILASRRARLFYPRFGNEQITDTILGLTNNRPFCSSNDYLNGTLVDLEWGELPENSPARGLHDQIARGGLECKKCPLDAWESVKLLGKEGKGKACGELRRLLFWSPGVTIPILLSVPVSSIRAWDGYCSSLEAVNTKHNLVVTEINLEKREAPGRKWSVMDFAKSGDMTESIAAELLTEKMTEDGIKKLHRHLLDVFKGREIGLDEYGDAGTSPSEDGGTSETTVENDEL